MYIIFGDEHYRRHIDALPGGVCVRLQFYMEQFTSVCMHVVRKSAMHPGVVAARACAHHAGSITVQPQLRKIMYLTAKLWSESHFLYQSSKQSGILG